jgi:hypothetical protein
VQNYNSKLKVSKTLNFKPSTLNSERGQALIILLFFVLVSIMVTSSAVILAFVNSQSAAKVQTGSGALNVAESGAEEAVLRLLRDPINYNSETLSVNGGTAQITVSTAGSTKTIVSTGTVNNFIRKIQVVADYTNNKLTVTSWKEIP